jgi:chromosome segregation ATPase
VDATRLRTTGQLDEVYAPALLARANQRLDQLQVVLDKTSVMLQQKSELLRQRTDECRALQHELDDTLAFLVDALSADGRAAPAADAMPDGTDKSAIMRQVETELQSLRADMSKADFLEQEQTAELDQLKAELLKTEAEITALQGLTQTELDALAAEKDALTSAATRVLVASGAAVVPALIELLADERAAVRSWAASVLGQIGPAAQEATPALTALLIDRDAQVREASQRALNRLAEAKAP